MDRRGGQRLRHRRQLGRGRRARRRNANTALVGAVVNDVATVAAGDAFTPGALAAEANATVNIDGSLTTTTDISGAARVNVDGQHIGNVAVRQDGTLQVNATGTVDGNVAAGGTTAPSASPTAR